MPGIEKRVPYFDYLRALAVTLVVVTHYHNAWAPGGSIGVSIFFCLSGFLITKILLDVGVATPRHALAFVVRRFLRIYPAYVAAIALMVLVMKCVHSDMEPPMLGALFGLLTFTRMPKWIGMEVGVFWTLRIEFWFYLMMPLVVMVFGRGRALLAAVLVLIAVSFLFKIPPMFHEPVPKVWVISPLLFWMDNLLYGSIIAILAFHKKINFSRLERRLFLCTGLVGLGAMALFVSADDSLTTWPLLSTGASIVGAAVIACHVGSEGAEKLAGRWSWVAIAVAWLGRISYSIYLLHAIPLDYKNVLSKPAFDLLQPTVLLAAAASYYLVEAPGIRMGRRLARAISPRRKTGSSHFVVGEGLKG